MPDAKLLTIPLIIPQSTLGNILGGTTFALDNSADALEFVFQAREAITITKIGFFSAGVESSSDTFTISLQGVGSTGNPDGTIKGGGSPCSHSFTGTSISVGWNWISLDNSYSCTRGEYLSIVLKTAADVDSTGAVRTVNSYSNTVGFPYGIQNNAGSRSRTALAGVPLFGYASSSKYYGYPCHSALSQSITSSNEFGISFTLPSSFGNTFKLSGLRAVINLPVTQTLTVNLYNGGGVGDTTVIQTINLDTDFVQANTAVKWLTIYFNDSTLQTLTCGNTYRLSFTCSGGTTTLSGLTLSAAGDADAYPLGQSVLGTSRSGGNWTDAGTNRPFIDLIIDDITPPSSGGGSIFGSGVIK